MAAISSAADVVEDTQPRVDDGADSTTISAVKPLGPPETHGHKTIYQDTTITFEAYTYWANRAREVEKHFPAGNLIKEGLQTIYGKKAPANNQPAAATPSTSEKLKSPDDGLATTDTHSSGEDQYGVTEAEWERAQRATRTATWGTIFYLITIDILGPYNVPWAISRMGYGPGIALYVSFGLMAFYSGLQLWQQFIGLDSPRYPMRNYGDLGFRIFGNWARRTINVLQSCQFFMNVTLLIEANGQGLQQMAAGANGKGVLCFVAAEVIFTVCGYILGQIRTLRRLGSLANVAVYLNLFVIFMTMAVTSKFGPNYDAAKATYNVPAGPVVTTADWPTSSTFRDRINGLMNGVYAYGGATLFNELMAEMRRPMDFWKAFLCAEIFIFAIYMTLGLVVYSYQGQFTFNPAYQGIPNSAYAWQTVGNAVSAVSSLIGALLYGNIGVKVFYAAVLRDVCGFPPLDHRTGKLVWAVLVPIYWTLALLVAAALPQISLLTSFVGAAFILQFSYTFPPLLMVGYHVQRDAAAVATETAGFDPTTGTVARVDAGWRRWVRGFRVRVWRNTFDLVYFVAAAVTAGLGVYASVVSMRESFRETSLTPFTCNSPTG